MNKTVINTIIWAIVILIEAMVVGAEKGNTMAYVLIPVLAGMIASLALVTDLKTTKKDSDSASK